MKKTLRLLMLIVVVMSLLPLSVLTASAKYDGRAVYDRANLFSATETALLEAKAKEYFGSSYASVYIVTDYNINYWGEDFLKEYGISGNCIVLIITANNARNYNLYTFGRCNSKVTNGEADAILDHSSVWNNIKSGRYYDGACGFIEQSAEACKTNVGKVFLLALLPSFAIALATFFGVKAYYAKKSRSEKYPLDRYASLSLRLKRDDFLGTFVTKRYISSSSGGKSGGSRGGGGGGRGHRGGR